MIARSGTGSGAERKRLRRDGSLRGPALAVLLALAVLAAGSIGGCADASSPETLQPKVSPPSIASAGVLKAAIDLKYPPFGGVSKGQRAGLDIDVASALARELGLKLEIVDASPTAGAELLRDRKVDVMLGGLPIEEAVSLDVAFAGPYINDAPAIFSANEDTAATMESISGATVGAQEGSLAYWLAAEEWGQESVVAYPTLADAMAQATSGTVQYVLGDGIVGAYMLRDFPGLRLNGQMAPASPIGVAVAKEAPDLEQAVRDALDRLSSTGVLETLRRKWLGDVPRFQGSTDASASAESTPLP